MPRVQRTLTTATPPNRVHAYLADFRNAEEWDPGTQTCERVSGDGGEGTTYRNVSRFLGRTTEVTYVATELTAPTLVHLTGHNEQFEGHDRISIRPSGAGSEVTYAAEFAFRGGARLAAPLVAAYLPMLARETMKQLQTSLDALA